MTPNLCENDLPRGFRFAATSCGLKKSGLDLGLLMSEVPATAACAFTTNLIKAAPIIFCQGQLRRSRRRARAIIVNSGNANCATGPAGLAASRATAVNTAHALGCRTEEILVCSTGVIGVPLRIEKILKSLPLLIRSLRGSSNAFARFTRAIMTTDTRPKWAAARCRIAGKEVRILGCAKGAGMIHPNLATMLVFLCTDARASPGVLSDAIRQAVVGTFNAITVDGDTSTNDTVALLANGQSGAPRISSDRDDFRRFTAALKSVCRSLALAIVADGEGAERVIEIEVRGAPSDRAADRVARTIAHSPLVKTALAGADPNWGRILAAAGRAGVEFNPGHIEIRVAGILMCQSGREHPFNERVAHRKLLGKYIPVIVDLGVGGGAARLWTCDFTAHYVDINASYRT